MNVQKDEGGRMKDEGNAPRRATVWILLLSSLILHPSSFAFAQPTQDEIIHSISDSFAHELDPSKLLAAAAIVLGVIVLIVVMNQRRKRQLAPKVLNHPGKLVKEVARQIGLKPAEQKRLRLLAERQDLSSPLLLLVCPSLLKKASQQKR
jgi:hypothetical protein